jgi:hypothetical protein
MLDITAMTEFILDAYASLGHRALPDGSLDARRLPGRTDGFIAVSQSRELLLLLEVGESTHIVERRLKAVQILSGDDFAIVEDDSGETVRRRFAVVSLRQGHQDLASSFAVVAATLLATLVAVPSGQDVIDFLDSLVDLLAPRRVASGATVVGLWGELWLIATAEDPAAFASAWHGAASDRFDFSFPDARIEVKTTTGSRRLHEFGLEQLEGGDRKPTLIASLTVANDASGSTVMDILTELLRVLPGALAARVSRVALATVAGDIESVQDYAFSPIGDAPLLAYHARSIPRVLVPRRAEISRVRFSADLSSIEPAARGQRALGLLAYGRH